MHTFLNCYRNLNFNSIEFAMWTLAELCTCFLYDNYMDMMIDILFKNTAGNVFLFLCGLEWWKTVDFVHINIRKH